MVDCVGRVPDPGQGSEAHRSHCGICRADGLAHSASRTLTRPEVSVLARPSCSERQWRSSRASPRLAARQCSVTSVRGNTLTRMIAVFGHPQLPSLCHPASRAACKRHPQDFQVFAPQAPMPRNWRCVVPGPDCHSAYLPWYATVLVWPFGRREGKYTR